MNEKIREILARLSNQPLYDNFKDEFDVEYKYVQKRTLTFWMKNGETQKRTFLLFQRVDDIDDDENSDYGKYRIPLVGRKSRPLNGAEKAQFSYLSPYAEHAYDLDITASLVMRD